MVSLVVPVEMEVMEENREATLSTKLHIATTEVQKEEMRARRLMGEEEVANHSKINPQIDLFSVKRNIMIPCYLINSVISKRCK